MYKDLENACRRFRYNLQQFRYIISKKLTKNTFDDISSDNNPSFT